MYQLETRFARIKTWVFHDEEIKRCAFGTKVAPVEVESNVLGQTAISCYLVHYHYCDIQRGIAEPVHRPRDISQHLCCLARLYTFHCLDEKLKPLHFSG